MSNLGRLKTKSMSLREVAIELTRRGVPTTRAYVAVVERRTLNKLRKMLMDDPDIQQILSRANTDE